MPAAATVCADDGAASAEVAFEAVPAALASRLRKVEPFAVGATGQLFTALRGADNQELLLKVYAQGVGLGVAERTRCKRELRKQASIAHVHLPKMFEDGEHGARLWMLREFLPAESLAVRLRRQGSMAPLDALAVVAQIASALDELHRQGLVHRDVKPGHVLLTQRPKGPALVRLIDSGFAARLPGEAPLEGYGTPGYAAPEIGTGKPASFRSDLYSLGCVMYELLAGVPPFAAPTASELLNAHRELEPKPLDVELPGAVRSLLDTLLAKEPRRRPFSARQVRRALEAYLPADMPELPTPGRSVVPPPSASAPKKLSSWPAARRKPAPSADPADNTEELSIEELEPASELAGPVKTQELDLVDIEPLPPLAPRTQELELADIESLPPPAPRTQELELADLEPLDGRHPRHISSRAPAPVAAAEPAARSDETPAVEIDAGSDSLEAPTIADVRIAAQLSAAVAQPSAAGDFVPKPAGSLTPPPAAGMATQPPRALEAAPLSAASEPEDEFAAGGEAASEAATVVEPSPAAAFAAEHGMDDATREMPREEPTRRIDSDAPLPPIPRRNRAWPLLAAAAVLAVIAFGLKLAKPGGAEHASRPAEAAAPVQPSTEVPQPVAAPKPAVIQPEPEIVAAAAPVPIAEPAPPAPPPEPEPVAQATAPAAPPKAAGDAKADAAVAADESAAPPTLTAAEAGKAYLREGTAPTPGGVVPYRVRPKQEIDYKSKGLQLFQAGKYREAADAYERASQKSPSDPRAFAGLGASWLSAGEADRAIQAYQRAVQLKPEVSGFQAALGRAYLTKGDRARAAAAYSKALVLDPTNQAAKSALATLQPKK